MSDHDVVSCCILPSVSLFFNPYPCACYILSGFKEEYLVRHEQHPDHKEAMRLWTEKNSDLKATGPMDAVVNVIPPSLQKQLHAKLVAANFIGTERVAMEKYGPLLDSFELAGLDVGTTHRNAQGFKDVMLPVIAGYFNKRVCERLQKARFNCISADSSTDQAGLHQEGVAIRTQGTNLTKYFVK